MQTPRSEPLKLDDERVREEDSHRGVVALFRDILGDLAAAAGAPLASETLARGKEGKKNAAAGPHGRLGDVVERLDERAFGLLLLLLALPCTLPFVYILPQIVALPMLALAAQMAWGRQSPWLPRALEERRFSIPAFTSVIDRAAKYVGWFEALARPRLTALTGRLGARVVGALLLIPAVSILTPLPSTNTVPGIGVAIAALGLIERDGLLVILGLLIGIGWVGLLLFFGVELATFIKEWLAARV